MITQEMSPSYGRGSTAFLRPAMSMAYAGAGLAVLFWFFESAMHAFVFLRESHSFHDELVSPPPHELYMRMLIVIMLVCFGFYAQVIVNRRRRAEVTLVGINEQLKGEMAERRHAEEATARAKEEWERTFNSVPDLIFLMDLDHNITRMNRAMTERLGIEGGALIGSSCYLTMHGRSLPIDGCPHMALLSDGKEHMLEVYEERLNGHFLVTVSPLLDGQGKLIGAIHVARDITARKQMEDELRKARDELELRVRERTAELADANEQLRHEVEERERAQEALKESERFLRSAFDALSAHIAVIDNKGAIISVNKAWRRFADSNGCTGRGYFVGSNYLHVCESASGDCSDEGLRALHGIRRVIDRQEDEFHMEYACQTPEEMKWFMMRVTRFAGDGPIPVVVAHEDITERKRIEEQLIHDALHDKLTGLANRTLFLDRLEHASQHSSRRGNYLFAVLFVDIDHFKLVNDSFGHLVGDKLLVAISHRIRTCVRSCDTVARFGGDEFCVLLDDLRDAGEALALAERIQAVLSSPFMLEDREIFTSASIGITLSETHYEQLEDMLRDADTAMYRAKALGRARHEMFDQEMHVQVVKRMQMETDLRKAIERGELVSYYQPIVSLESGRLAGFEALIRWMHPEKGLVPPMEFIPLAEETDLILPIGLWILREACSQMRQWQAELPSARDLMISVNLSGKQFAKPDLPDQVAQVLEETGLEPSLLKLEVTESMLMENDRSVRDMLARLKSLGIQLGIDDFGTGYSSLSYLHKLPVDVLKVDRSFVSNMSLGDENYQIVQTIVNLAHNLGLSIIAEGPETAGQVSQLSGLGCEFAQGYFFARPMESSKAKEFIRPEPIWIPDRVEDAEKRR